MKLLIQSIAIRKLLELSKYQIVTISKYHCISFESPQVMHNIRSALYTSEMENEREGPRPDKSASFLPLPLPLSFSVSAQRL